jgi:hypothetical protein
MSKLKFRRPKYDTRLTTKNTNAGKITNAMRRCEFGAVIAPKKAAAIKGKNRAQYAMTVRVIGLIREWKSGGSGTPICNPSNFNIRKVNKSNDAIYAIMAMNMANAQWAIFSRVFTGSLRARGILPKTPNQIRHHQQDYDRGYALLRF